MIVLLCSDLDLISGVIRFRTLSRWGHAAVLHPDYETVHEAVWAGVHKTTLDALKRRENIIQAVELPVRHLKKALFFLAAQEGKPYDKLGLFGLGMNRDWDQRDHWFCSKLVTAAAMAGDTFWFRKELLDWVTPGLLGMLPGNVLFTYRKHQKQKEVR